MKRKTKKMTRKEGTSGFSALDTKLDRVIDAMVTKEDLHTFQEEIEERISSLESTVSRLIIAVDSMKKSLDDLLLEYAAIKEQLARHERWFKEIARKTGLTLKA